jgi:hypothetical protein
MNEKNETFPIGKRGGRIPKNDPAVYCCMVRFNSVDYARMLTLFERSGMKTKARFIVSMVFNEEFKVISIDVNTVNYFTRLTNFYAQFRAVAVNYNQIVKALKTNFTEKKALAFLYKLEAQTKELAELYKQVIKLTEEFEQKWLRKST